MTRRKVGYGVVVVLLLVGSVIMMVVNPFNWGVPKSSRFSFGRFAEVHRGMRVEQAIRLLGSPVRVVNDVRAPLCPHDEACRNFIFADEPASWVMFYRKAWVIVDRNGTVVDTVLYEEP